MGEWKCSISVDIMKAKKSFFNFTEGKLYVSKFDNRNGIYTILGEGDNSVSFDQSTGDFRFLENFEVIAEYEFENVNEALGFAKVALEKALVIDHYINEECEVQEALYDAIKDEVIMQGNYEYEKIGYIIDGFVDGLDYVNEFVILTELKINRNHEMFEKLGFFKIDKKVELEKEQEAEVNED